MALDKLSAQNIQDFITDFALPAHEFNVIVEDCLPSTNDYLLGLLAQEPNLLQKTAVLAETQTNGRGRYGRNWVSVPGNIMLSLFWPMQCSLDKLYGLSLVVGIAIARVLKANGLDMVQLKWPNDIYWNARKMGGILIETKQNKPGIMDVIIGIGLNIVTMDEYSAQIEQKIVSLESALQRKVNRDKLVAQLLLELNNTLTRFTAAGFNVFIDEWKALDAKINSQTQDMDLFTKLISAEKLLRNDDKNVH